jgi:Rho guanine nucleotide exchange factor 10
MALQLALTTLESLAEMLNERKRESEQIAAFRAKLRLLGGKLGGGGAGRVLLREDNVTRLEFNAAGQVCRSKPRRLLLLNDRVVCVAASGRPSEVEMGGMGGGGGSGSGQGEKLCLKWSAGEGSQ